ncbi:MAG: uroporphyrinogen-III synthase [Rhodospirillales bacterium]|nr:uroporphyrinogen-III synthase [Alphaproteobacteria bacterium]MCB1840335.1 uroporphyrinogen-III synthase [Alphaproteobacteria bacterium]MCB9976987.1 uroporphyrinogen-III synthase [Rhodospirillales bacterium]
MTLPLRPRILITRPDDQGQDFIDAMRQTLGQKFYAEQFTRISLMDVLPVPFRLVSPKSFDGLIITSSNGLRSFCMKMNELRVNGDWPEGYLKLPLYVVGQGTAQRAGSEGFENVHTPADSADALKNYLYGLAASSGVGPGKRLRLLFIRGETVHADFEQILPSEQFEVTGLTVYTSRPTDLSPATFKGVFQPDNLGAVTFFSARTAKLFFEHSQRAQMLLSLKKPEALCISKNVLETVRSFWGHRLYVAETPNQEGMVELVTRRLKDMI